MCLIAIALHAHPRWPMVVVANRDEFHSRASEPFGEWPDTPGVWGGRDAVAGGSWLALRGHRFAAVTNVRRMVPVRDDAPSRGWLVRDFVTADASSRDHLDRLAPQASVYAGFNLLVADGDGAWFASNRPSWNTQALAAGIHVVSNASLDTPWPKSERLRNAVRQWADGASEDLDDLFAALADETAVADRELPDTGLPIDRERLLAPAFIRSAMYGTRSSTIALRDAVGAWRAVERRFGPDGSQTGETSMSF
jgi:uncharacterized protein with NRDE domain